ncbi:MAG: OmpH family outer membrane protein [Alphaproteobacteria bacterium]|nr:OmpH family outer membrane protein [Alphaproteobacteria bacterium]MDX5370304.1 OmpH family outer membrane protein [Alphaproteobacteria bacterium]MDX5464840.1 OmpH family outer membrane protein [Alphaproteobacteria bacterium]
MAGHAVPVGRLLGLALASTLLAVAAPGLPSLTARAQQADMSSPRQVPAARIAVVDTGALMRDSKAAKRIQQEIETLNASLQTDATAAETKLRDERDALNAQRNLLSQDGFQQRVRAFEEEVRATQIGIQERSRAIQLAQQKAQSQLRSAIEPILRDILAETGGNLLLERQRVVLHDAAMDITATALERLDALDPQIEVTLTGAEQ